jgi:hypothetical protein
MVGCELPLALDSNLIEMKGVGFSMNENDADATTTAGWCHDSHVLFLRHTNE